MASKPIYTLATAPFVVYDNAVRDFIQTQVVGENGVLADVPVVFATPRKEFGSQTILNPDRVDPITRKSPAEDKKAAHTVPYPTMGVIRLSPVFDWGRFRPMTERKLRITDRDRSWTQARYALPWDLQYQIDIRVKYRTHLNQIIQNIILKFFEPVIYLNVEWGEPYGKKNIELMIEEIRDNSVLEKEADNEDRTLRATITLLLKSWFVQKLTSTPTALKIYSDTYVVVDFNEDLTDKTPEFSVEQTPDNKIVIVE